jgi:hypothetical protein
MRHRPADPGPGGPSEAGPGSPFTAAHRIDRGGTIWPGRTLQPPDRVATRRTTNGRPGHLVRAAVLGQVDDWGLKPWQPGDEGFHQLVVGLLYEWAQLHRPGFQAVQVVGEQWSARAHELRDMLARNRVLYGFLPADSEEGRALLERVGATAEQLPVVVTFDGLVLRDPSVAEVAEALSAPTRLAAAAYDVTVVGAGPAGLAAAVYGASEGLGTALLEPVATGGQAGTTSMIRNYLGFPRGISGAELAYRAFHQAIGFGADIVYGQRAVGLHAAGSDRVVTLDDGTEVSSRAVVLATGVTWRRLGVASLEALVGDRDRAGDRAVHPDRRRAPHRLAPPGHPAGPVGVRGHRHRPAPGRPAAGRLAAGPAPDAAGDQPARRVRGRRRPPWVDQAGRRRGRGGLGRHPPRPRVPAPPMGDASPGAASTVGPICRRCPRPARSTSRLPQRAFCA